MSITVTADSPPLIASRRPCAARHAGRGSRRAWPDRSGAGRWPEIDDAEYLAPSASVAGASAQPPAWLPKKLAGRGLDAAADAGRVRVDASRRDRRPRTGHRRNGWPRYGSRAGRVPPHRWRRCGFASHSWSSRRRATPPARMVQLRRARFACRGRARRLPACRARPPGLQAARRPRRWTAPDPDRPERFQAARAVQSADGCRCATALRHAVRGGAELRLPSGSASERQSSLS